MIKDIITGERFSSIEFKDYCFAHRHIGRHKTYLEVSLWKGQNLRGHFAIQCQSTKTEYIDACKTIWNNMKKYIIKTPEVKL